MEVSKQHRTKAINIPYSISSDASIFQLSSCSPSIHSFFPPTDSPTDASLNHKHIFFPPTDSSTDASLNHKQIHRFATSVDSFFPSNKSQTHSHSHSSVTKYKPKPFTPSTTSVSAVSRQHNTRNHYSSTSIESYFPPQKSETRTWTSLGTSLTRWFAASFESLFPARKSASSTQSIPVLSPVSVPSYPIPKPVVGDTIIAKSLPRSIPPLQREREHEHGANVHHLQEDTNPIPENSNSLPSPHPSQPTDKDFIFFPHTASLVKKMETVRVLISIAAIRSWSLYQMDPPPELKYDQQKVSKLNRTLYGLKKEGHAWSEKLQSFIIGEAGLKTSKYDSSLFYSTTVRGNVVLLVYVDDVIITGTDAARISWLKKSLEEHLEMKDLGALRCLEGIEIYPTPEGYDLSQSSYAAEVITLAQLTDVTPIELYRQVVGCLNYLTVTRPDISYAVDVVTKYIAAPESVHRSEVEDILKYVGQSLDMCHHLPSSSSLELRAHSGACADWLGDVQSKRWSNGWCLYLGNSLISWKSEKRDARAAGAGYNAASEITARIAWLRGLLSEMEVELSSSSTVFCDKIFQILPASTISRCTSIYHDTTRFRLTK